MRILDILATAAVVSAIPCGTIAWATLNLPLMGVALGMASLAAGLGWLVARVEIQKQ